ncbi:hypothetical protein BS78_06G173800 [Paspalum vaginatum]|nr:hypothetical protein BS78_06G173800 [Paspalum vaginatum]
MLLSVCLHGTVRAHHTGPSSKVHCICFTAHVRIYKYHCRARRRSGAHTEKCLAGSSSSPESAILSFSVSQSAAARRCSCRSRSQRGRKADRNLPSMQQAVFSIRKPLQAAIRRGPEILQDPFTPRGRLIQSIRTNRPVGRIPWHLKF